VSPTGGILGVHVTAFLASVDSLLAAGRSNSPAQVLSPMKAVINAVTSIIDDLRSYAEGPASAQSGLRSGELESLRDRVEATLGNLVAAAKTHATSAGLSPVSLLDAAASHVAAAITDVGRSVLIRGPATSEQDTLFYPSSPSSGKNGVWAQRGGEEGQNIDRHRHGQSQASISSRSTTYPSGRPPSGHSLSGQLNSGQSSSALLFDLAPASYGSATEGSGGSGGGEGSEEAWAELKVYSFHELDYVCLLAGSHTSKLKLNLLFMQYSPCYRVFAVPLPHPHWPKISRRLLPLCLQSLLSAPMLFRQETYTDKRFFVTLVSMLINSARCRLYPTSPRRVDRLWPRVALLLLMQ
jgi:hypothetical protein